MKLRFPLCGLILAAGLSLAIAAANADESTPSSPAALAPIASLDVPRYMGTWHEVAKYPNWFQRKCVGDTTAHYRLQADGRVEVTNRCRTDDDRFIEVVGIARQIGAEDSPVLKVRFAPAWLSFIPFVWGDYWLIDLDPDYQLAAVSEPGRKYLWILSRTPQVAPSAYQALLERLARMGFDLDRLEAAVTG
ncbi:lipocalin family protein [Rhodocyclaceae bacterium SMB388]